MSKIDNLIGNESNCLKLNLYLNYQNFRYHYFFVRTKFWLELKFIFCSEKKLIIINDKF